MLYYFLMLGEKYFLFSATFPTSPTWFLKTNLKINALYFCYVGNVANVGSKQSFLYALLLSDVRRKIFFVFCYISYISYMAFKNKPENQRIIF